MRCKFQQPCTPWTVERWRMPARWCSSKFWSRPPQPGITLFAWSSQAALVFCHQSYRIMQPGSDMALQTSCCVGILWLFVWGSQACSTVGGSSSRLAQRSLALTSCFTRGVFLDPRRACISHEWQAMLKRSSDKALTRFPPSLKTSAAECIPKRDSTCQWILSAMKIPLQIAWPILKEGLGFRIWFGCVDPRPP